MTILEMLGQSITMTGLGMAVVFSFLVILIISLTLVHRLVVALKLDVEEKAAPAAQPRQDTARTVAAIAAALKSKTN